MDLSSKVELALATYLGGQAIIPNIVQGEASLDKDGPVIICLCAGGGEDPPFTGNYWMDFEVLLRSQFGGADDGIDPKVLHDQRSEQMINSISDSNLPALLTASCADFTVMGTEQFSQSSQASQDAWETSVKGRLYCCGSAFPN